MKKLLIITTLGSALLLSGCTGTGGITIPPNVQVIIDRVQMEAAKYCAYVPTAQTVLSLISLGDPSLSSVIEIVKGICSVVSKPTVRRGAAKPVLKGVVIQGSFVRRGR